MKSFFRIHPYTSGFLSQFVYKTLFSLFALFAAHELCAVPEQAKKAEDKGISLIEFKAGYFFFGAEEMNEVFDDGGLDVQLAASGPVWKWLHLYGSVEYLQRHGRSIHGHQKTSIWEVPLSFGVKPVIRINNWAQYYITLGPRYFFVHVHNDSHYVSENISQNGLGGFVGTGFNFEPIHHLLIDLFGEYSYKRMHFSSSVANSHGHTVQVGGFTFGGGIGYAF